MRLQTRPLAQVYSICCVMRCILPPRLCVACAGRLSLTAGEQADWNAAKHMEQLLPGAVATEHPLLGSILCLGPNQNVFPVKSCRVLHCTPVAV